MINITGVKYPINNKYNSFNKKNVSKTDANFTYSDEFLDIPVDIKLNYFVPFTGNSSKNSTKMSKLDNILYYADTPTKKFLSSLKQEAKDTGYNNITTMHVIKYGLMDLYDYLDELNSGHVDLSINDRPEFADIIIDSSGSNIFSNSELREKFKKLISKNIKDVEKILKVNKPKSSNISSDISLSDDLVDAVWGVRNEDSPIDMYSLMAGVIASPDDITSDFVNQFLTGINKLAMINDLPLGKRTPFSIYNKKAENVLKNISLGNEIFVTYDPSKETPQPFIDTIFSVVKNSKKNLSITEFNEYARREFFVQQINTLAKDKSKEHIVIANPIAMIMLGGVQADAENKFVVPPYFLQTILKHPSNIKFLFYSTKDNYYSMLNSGASIMFSNFEEAALPNLSTEQMVKAFKENPLLMKDIQKPFSRNAIEKVIVASAQMDGAFPLKTLSLMKKIVSYYIDKKEINDTDVANYLKEATNLFKKSSDDSSIEISFETGKRLKDLIGKESTKKEAASIVKQIKSGKMGTKGIVIYSQDGSPGSGRRYTAKVIAGEAKVPYIEINTMDFGTKEVDLFGGGALSPEASMKKLFSIVKTQAEANPKKSAVLFIENFEYFSVGELVSYYHQKAMAQLLREMEKADKAGLNILVAGSVASPDLIGEATMKSFKFVDSVEVSSPAYNKEERAQIIKRAIKDAKIKLAGTEEEQKNAIDSTAAFTHGFPFIYLKNLVKKAQSVAVERGHKAVSKADLTEAYLQITTGRPAINHIEEHEKQVVASHECGHATNLEVMNNIAKTIGKPWHIPDKVNFITLDPRGVYGGAVYHGRDKNREMSFENVFASIVCSFGGNSAENLFFGMDGSLGISGDMESVRDYADIMVKSFGMGANTGKMVIDRNEEVSENLKSLIEKDERVIINNARMVSDLITEIYADFNRQFTSKYAPLVGTGECIMDGDEFRKALVKWKSEQTPEKQKELKLCDEAILKIINATKKGITVRKEE